MKKKIALVSMLFFVFFCKEENKEVPKQETQVKEEKIQDMKTEYVFNGSVFHAGDTPHEGSFWNPIEFKNIVSESISRPM
ncbi:hypothetical protein LEP1GSC086_1341, partial [Leptospira weilii str. LNT 1234]